MKKELLATDANVITQQSAGYENALMEGYLTWRGSSSSST